MRKNTCCFTGHRPHKLHYGFEEDHPDCIKLKIQIALEIQAMIGKGCDTFITGMAMGTDIWCAELTIDLRRASTAKGIKLVAVIPYEGQANRWNRDYQERYYNILSKADDVVTLAAHYHEGCMQERNQHIVNRSAHMIAVFNGSGGCTKNTINYARKTGLDTVILNPKDLSKIQGEIFRDFIVLR